MLILYYKPRLCRHTAKLQQILLRIPANRAVTQSIFKPPTFDTSNVYCNYDSSSNMIKLNKIDSVAKIKATPNFSCANILDLDDNNNFVGFRTPTGPNNSYEIWTCNNNAARHTALSKFGVIVSRDNKENREW